MAQPITGRHVVVAFVVFSVAQILRAVWHHLPDWSYLAANLLFPLTAFWYLANRLGPLAPQRARPIVNGLGGTNVDHVLLSINRKMRTRLEASEVLARAQTYFSGLPVGFRIARQGANCLHVVVPAGQRTLMALARVEHSLRIAVTPRPDGTDVRIFGEGFVEWSPVIDDLLAQLAY